MAPTSTNPTILHLSPDSIFMPAVQQTTTPRSQIQLPALSSGQTTLPSELSPAPPSLVQHCTPLAASTSTQYCTTSPGINLLVDLTRQDPLTSPAITKTHSMVTRSQMGSLKPHNLVAMVFDSDETPSSFTQANKHLH